MATKKQIIADVTALISAEVSDTTLEAVHALLDSMGKKAAAGGRAKEIEVEGTTYRWCNRHAQYEPLDWFIVEKNGKVKPECAAAFFKWQEIGKQINKAIKDADGGEIGRLTLLRKSKDGYNLADDIESFSEEITEALGMELDAEEALPEQEEK